MAKMRRPTRFLPYFILSNYGSKIHLHHSFMIALQKTFEMANKVLFAMLRTKHENKIAQMHITCVLYSGELYQRYGDLVALNKKKLHSHFKFDSAQGDGGRDCRDPPQTFNLYK